ncbi:unnamed protein product [Strongylus vulgaris]|uniref:Uncharacterized protein n=1 Tax=Strongylus vulgaris TaxID=40348 RepID=A0A3P7IU18_STRVU|nr:unnamed protein product [Strongylus vulgaris]
MDLLAGCTIFGSGMLRGSSGGQRCLEAKNESLTHDKKEELHDVEPEPTSSGAGEYRAMKDIQQVVTAFTNALHRKRKSRMEYDPRE